MRQINYAIFILFISCITMTIPQSITNDILFRSLGNCEVIKLITGKSYIMVGKQAFSKLQNCFLQLHTSTGTIEYPILDAARDLSQSSHLNKNLPVVIISHGLLSNSYDPGLLKAANDIKSLGNVNVFMYDYGVLVDNTYLYFLASTNVQYAGEALGRVLAELHKIGIPRIHLIGFSLGAHVSSFAGKEFYRITGSKIDRISGLDPASPCFYKLPSNKRLTQTDAVFVDVMYTEMYFKGPIGHVNFYPNGGRDQPGCNSDGGCDHNKAINYAENITNPNFLSVQCSDWDTFLNRGCTNNVQASMGYFLPDSTPSGNYYFITNSDPPYALGAAGIM